MTVTFGDVDIDNHVLDALDFKHTIPCEEDECDNEAKFKLVTKCCAFTMLACEDCMLAGVEYVKKWLATGRPGVCASCGFKHYAPGIPFLVLPLDKQD